MAGQTLQYDVVDVFTERPFAGNPLAVVHGAQDLADEQLAALAAEFNLSETTFPTAPSGRGDYAVRIFTPGGEIPFAGHPTLGTAWVLRHAGRLRSGDVTQECGVGLVDVHLPDGDGPVELSANPRDLSGPVEGDRVAAAVGLSADDISGVTVVAGAGLSFVHLPVTGVAALARAHPATGGLSDLGRHGIGTDPLGGVNVYTVTEGAADRLAVRSRVFCPDLSVPEDPATGSAAAGLGIALVATGRLPQHGGRYQITQGVEMGRPSRLHGRVEADGGTVTRCHVAGGVVPVASG
ncbi:MAG: PhzF family phenazine biosynthesis protein, partial [Actinomycetota bacterium]|nr:PhzF family phenazine biosynthesis protein [Actinomycetota bacterium]